MKCMLLILACLALYVANLEAQSSCPGSVARGKSRNISLVKYIYIYILLQLIRHAWVASMRVMPVGIIADVMRIEDCGISIPPLNAASRWPIEDAVAIRIAIARWKIVNGHVDVL